MRWLEGKPASSARPAERSTPNGRAGAMLAAPGTASSKKALRRPIGGGAQPAREGTALRARGFDKRRIRNRRAAPRVSANSTRVCGGGLVPGLASIVWSAADPGVGKSTAYPSGLGGLRQERAAARSIFPAKTAMAQVRLAAPAAWSFPMRQWRSVRPPASKTFFSTLEKDKPPGVVAIDSIQTIWTSALEAAPGTIAASAHGFVRSGALCQGVGAVVILVGHVTEGRPDRRTPRRWEHLVDARPLFRR